MQHIFIILLSIIVISNGLELNITKITYAEALSSAKCSLHCEDQDQTQLNKCLDNCKQINWNSNFSRDSDLASSFKITPPVLECQELVSVKNSISAKLLISWNITEGSLPEDVKVIFIIQVKIASKTFQDWQVLGMTSNYFEEINKLQLSTKYRFQITAVLSSGLVLPSVLSEWILTPGDMEMISAPTNITPIAFHSTDRIVDVVINWTPPRELPCSYKVFWLPMFGGDFFEQKTISQPLDRLPMTISNLMFKTNYSIEVTPYDHRPKKSAETWFTTPSCVDMNGANFTICPPGAPQDLRADWNFNGSDAIVSWSPPLFTSDDNIILRYSVTVLQDVPTSENFGPYDDTIIVPGNTTTTTVAHLSPLKTYLFEVFAVSKGGKGMPTAVHLFATVPSIVQRNSDSPIWYYILVPLIAVASLSVFLTLFCKCRNNGKKGTIKNDTQCSEIPSHLRPYLIPLKNVELLETLGHGAFGVVRKGLMLQGKEKEPVAVKEFLSPMTDDSVMHLLREVELMMIIGRHRHIVGLRGYCINDSQQFLLLEYCPLGDLLTKLTHLRAQITLPSETLEYIDIERISTIQMQHDRVAYFDDNSSQSVPGDSIMNDSEMEKISARLISYMYQVALGMNHISSHKFVHRDIAARNILVYSEEVVKIADFGLARDVYENRTYTINASKRLPIKWMSLEAIADQTFTTWSDVWAFGVLMWEIKTFGMHPYPGYENDKILSLLTSGHRLQKPENCSHELYDIMLSCWNVKPICRPAFYEIKQKLELLLARQCNYLDI